MSSDLESSTRKAEAERLGAEIVERLRPYIGEDCAWPTVSDPRNWDWSCLKISRRMNPEWGPGKCLDQLLPVGSYMAGEGIPYDVVRRVSELRGDFDKAGQLPSSFGVSPEEWRLGQV